MPERSSSIDRRVGGAGTSSGWRRWPSSSTPSTSRGPGREKYAAASTAKTRAPSGTSRSRCLIVSAAAYFSRPGPRLVEGVELLGHLLHPELVPAPPTRRSIEVDLT